MQEKQETIQDFSQHGEQEVILENLPEMGTLISIGENDGTSFSNCRQLILNGWRAHLVEPSPKALVLLQNLYKDYHRVTIYPYAITKQEGEIDFYECDSHCGYDTGLLSTTVESEIKRWGRSQNFEKIKVQSKTFRGFLAQAPELYTADFISIDAEGMDFEILAQIPLVRLQTKLVCVETNSVNDNKYIRYMTKLGFKPIHKNYCNIIFKKDLN